MNIEEICRICKENGRRPLMIGVGRSAAVAALGMEGRIFYGRDGEAVSIFRREAAEKISTSKTGYFNPGGDGLWPAPEGTRFGYNYPTGAWRVPMALATAQYEVVSQRADGFEISAELDLVNDQQIGLPCRFTRRVMLAERPDGATVIEQFDAIEYIGARELSSEVCRLAPWSLSQFAVDDRSAARFRAPGIPVRDFYEPSASLLSRENGVISMRRDPERRVQIALPEACGFIELVMPDRKLRVRRELAPLKDGLQPIDIADAPPDADPVAPVRYSIYTDPSGFMELEVAGGCPEHGLKPGDRLEMHVTNTIEQTEE